jgi:fructokinase
MNNPLSNKVVCFGEILWDVLPDVRRPGGAPMNVAYHLQKLGVDSSVISSVGRDDAGTSLLEFLRSIGLSEQTIQVNDEQATSAVIASMNEQHEVSYEILFPVAWDFIKWKPEYAALLANSQAFVFGSLASRNNVSADTLLKMLDYPSYKVFDVNLREPHYSFDVIDRLLRRADLIKLNAAELALICQWFNPELSDEQTRIDFLFNHFLCNEIVITKGAKGASYYTRTDSFDSPAIKVTVNDTIGSGDSFLAAFLAKKLKGEDPQKALNYATALGAFITSKSGACPPYSTRDLENFIEENSAGNHS